MPDAAPVPEGFEVTREGPVTLVLRGSRAAALRAAGIADPEEAARAAGAAARAFEGRGKPVSFPVPGAPGLRVIARRYLRGGLLRGLAGGLFPGAGRFLRELRVAEDLFRRGVPVPEPLGVVVKASAAGTARGWFLSREVEGVEDLRSLLLRLPPGDPARREAMRAAGRAVRRLHDAGALHADLHVKNLLLPRGGGDAIVVDLDGATLQEQGLGRDQRARQILRLDRSLVKLAFKSGRPIPASDRRRLVLAYLGEDRPTREESVRWRKRQRAELARHRVGWRLGTS
jgi:tRNA A-37 threonylcarbamoyl transferase component Bud32